MGSVQSECDREPVGDLLTAVAQDERTGRVLMVAHMDEVALSLTSKEKRAVYYSRTRRRTWRKGETSGNIQEVRGLRFDCDRDAVLLTVRQVGSGACHTGEATCFEEEEGGFGPSGPVLDRLWRTVGDRLRRRPAGSYTAQLAAGGTARAAQKVVEEAGELALAAALGRKQETVAEAADLLYHVTVLLSLADVNFADVAKTLADREQVRS